MNDLQYFVFLSIISGKMLNSQFIHVHDIRQKYYIQTDEIILVET